MASPVDQDNQPQDATDTDNLTVLTALLNAEDARLSEFLDKSGLETCRTVLQETSDPQVVLTTLQVLNRLQLNSQLVVASGIGKTVLKLKKSDSVTDEAKSLATALIQKWSNHSVEKSVTKTNTGILRKRSIEAPAQNGAKVARLSPIPHAAKARRIRFRDECLGEPLVAIREYEIDGTSNLRPVTRKADVKEERQLSDADKRRRLVMVDKIKAMMPTMAWCPPPRVFLPPSIEETLQNRGKHSAEKVRLAEHEDFPHVTARNPEGPAEPPHLSGQPQDTEPQVLIPTESLSCGTGDQQESAHVIDLTTADESEQRVNGELLSNTMAAGGRQISHRNLFNVLQRVKRSSNTSPVDAAPPAQAAGSERLSPLSLLAADAPTADIAASTADIAACPTQSVCDSDRSEESDPLQADSAGAHTLATKLESDPTLVSKLMNRIQQQHSAAQTRSATTTPTPDQAQAQQAQPQFSQASAPAQHQQHMNALAQWQMRTHYDQYMMMMMQQSFGAHPAYSPGNPNWLGYQQAALPAAFQMHPSNGQYNPFNGR